MQRKIIQQSATSVGISLPVKWVKQWNLQKGNPVDIQNNDGVLEVRATHYQPPEKKATIDAQHYGKLTRRKFDNLSKSGFDEITVLYKSEEDLKPIKESIQTEATMFEIVKKEKEYIVLRAISEIHLEEIEKLEHRLIYLLREKIAKVKEYVNINDVSLLQDVLELEKANNHLVHLCLRYYNRQGQGSFIIYTSLWLLEKIANDFKFFALQKPQHLHTKTQALFQKVLTNLYVATELYFKYNSKKAIQFYETRKKITAQCLEYLQDQTLLKNHTTITLIASLNEKGLYYLGLLFGSKHTTPTDMDLYSKSQDQ